MSRRSTRLSDHLFQLWCLSQCLPPPRTCRAHLRGCHYNFCCIPYYYPAFPWAFPIFLVSPFSQHSSSLLLKVVLGDSRHYEVGRPLQEQNGAALELPANTILCNKVIAAGLLRREFCNHCILYLEFAEQLCACPLDFHYRKEHLRPLAVPNNV